MIKENAVVAPTTLDEDEYYSPDFFECRKGHAFCARH
jgi:hypothetical protein